MNGIFILWTRSCFDMPPTTCLILVLVKHPSCHVRYTGTPGTVQYRTATATAAAAAAAAATATATAAAAAAAADSRHAATAAAACGCGCGGGCDCGCSSVKDFAPLELSSKRLRT